MARGTKGSSRAKAKGQAKSRQLASKVLGILSFLEKSNEDYWQKVERLEQFGSTFSTMQNLLNGKHPDETDLREIWSILACYAMSTKDIHDKWIEDMEQKVKGKIASNQYAKSEKEKLLEKLAVWKNKEMQLQNLMGNPQFWAGSDLNANQMLGWVNEIQDLLAATRKRLDEKKAREDRERFNSLRKGAISDIESKNDALERIESKVDTGNEGVKFLVEDRKERIDANRKKGARNQNNGRDKRQGSGEATGPGEQKGYEKRKEEAFKRVAAMKLQYGEKKIVYHDEGEKLGLKGPDFGREYRRWLANQKKQKKRK